MPSKASFYHIEVSLRAACATARNAGKTRRRTDAGPTDLFLCIADHFEPQVGRADPPLARVRMEDWLRRYPQIASAHHDADGRPPAHTFFYPWDEYDAWEFDRMGEICAAGYGEIELHLHHRDDTEATLRQKLAEALHAYREKGALASWPDGRIAFGFVHGNWALDNSRCEGERNYCGVNNELTVLSQMGCYADFTFPAWQQTAQPRQTNSIFYATDDPLQPKSYDTGQAAKTGREGTGDLLLIQGPLAPYWERSGRRIRPAMDDGDLACYRRYAPERLDRWVRAGIHVQGRPDRIFIKLHCHGAEDRNRMVLLGEDLNALFTDAEARYNDGKHYRLHYVTAREMFNMVKATEAETPSTLESARDWLLPRPKQAALLRR